jgi:hypothetical protein
MVREIYSVTKDSRLLEEALPLLIREHNYWTSGYTVIIIMIAFYFPFLCFLPRFGGKKCQTFIHWHLMVNFTADPKQVTIVDGEGNKHYLSRYWADWRAPRPESFTIVSVCLRDGGEEV